MQGLLPAEGTGAQASGQELKEDEMGRQGLVFLSAAAQFVAARYCPAG